MILDIRSLNQVPGTTKIIIGESTLTQIYLLYGWLGISFTNGVQWSFGPVLHALSHGNYLVLTLLGHCRSPSDMHVRRVSGCLELLFYLDEFIFCLVCWCQAGYSQPPGSLSRPIFVCVFFWVKSLVLYQESRAL